MLHPDHQRLIDELSEWIEPQHLTPSGIEAFKSSLAKSPPYGVYLDNFLKEDIISKITKAVENEAEFIELYLLHSSEERVNQETFWQAAPENRFLYRRYVHEEKEEFRMSKNWIAYKKFCSWVGTLLPRYLELLNENPLKIAFQRTHSHQYRHFLNPHTDTSRGRKLCTILYLSPRWTPQYGGALVLEGVNNGEQKRIEALPNRLVIFYPMENTEHYVERHTEEAKDANRISHVAWFTDAELA